MGIDRKAFVRPERRYGIYPIIHGAVAGDLSRAERLERLGFAGIVGNVPYGRTFPDDAKEWRDTAEGFKDYIRRGMPVWIYDEKGYPSGTAGGAVTDAHPDTIAEGLFCYEYWRTLSGPMYYRADTPGDKLFRAMLLPLAGGEALDVTASANERGTLLMDIPAGEYHLFLMSSRRLFDGTHAAHSYSEPRNYINLLDRKATEAFVEVTHERYAALLADEFGRGVRAFFTDEPSLIAWNIPRGVYPIVPWQREFPARFQARYGYPIELAVVAVVTKRGPQLVKRRCDFWEFVGDGVAENFFGVLQDWCRAHGVKSSGHMLAEEHLQAHVVNYGSLYKCGKRMDWPGIDQLNSEPPALMNDQIIPIARLLASFADISGEGESFTEFSDHCSRMANKQIGLDWIRASVNWHVAMGITNLTSYYNWDYFAEDDIRALNQYTARLGGMIRQGRRDSRVALLYPEASIWSVYTPSVEPNAMDHSEACRRVNDAFAKTSWELLHRQIDFDYVDEDLINDAEIADGKLAYRDRRYECVVLPAVTVLSCRTVDKLAAMLAAGIGVVVIGDVPAIARETGEDAPFAAKLLPHLASGKLAQVPLQSGWTLPGPARLRALPRPIQLRPRGLSSVLTGATGSGTIVDGEAISPNILSHTRVLPDGSRLVFLCNMGGKTYDGFLQATGAAAAELADPGDGSFRPAQTSHAGDALVVDIRLRAYDALFVLLSPTP
ncbi:MAG: hypothetical protein GX617_03835 [Lentisphaerae bacterium]|nr:hypothetical protein [Lentisphaerota bacterium]